MRLQTTDHKDQLTATCGNCTSDISD